jgi:hypothetical protein
MLFQLHVLRVVGLCSRKVYNFTCIEIRSVRKLCIERQQLSINTNTNIAKRKEIEDERKKAGKKGTQEETNERNEEIYIS